jgi:hypothetical protein
MAMRAAGRKYDREEMVAYLHGIDPQGNVAHLLVYKKGDRVRFTGEHGNHDVAHANAADLGEWIREAETACGLIDVLGVYRGCMQTPANLEKFELLNANAAKKKKEIEAASQL